MIHDGKEYAAKTDNLSLGGMHLIAIVQPPFGAAVEIRFRIPGMKTDSVCAGTVRWSRGSDFGIQFQSLRPIDVWGLNQYFKARTPLA